MLFCQTYLASRFMKILKSFFLFVSIIPFILNAQTGRSRDSIWIDKNDIEHMSIPELYLMKETIYAKHNYSFKSDSSRIYFSQFDWYSPNHRNSLVVLSDQEELTIAKLNDRIESILYEKAYLPEHLTDKNRNEQFKNITLKEKGHIGLFTYTIKNVFKYNDREGDHIIFLGESPYNPFSLKQDRAIFNNVVKAVYCKAEGNYLMKRIEIEDLIDPKSSLFDIRFMPQYIFLDDIDQDGLTDPIITYTSMGKDGYENGWTRINLIHKKNIITISIQNSTKKEKRLLSVSSRFHILPRTIKRKLIDLVETLKKDKICTLDNNWRDSFKHPSK